MSYRSDNFALISNIYQNTSCTYLFVLKSHLSSVSDSEAGAQSDHGLKFTYENISFDSIQDHIMLFMIYYVMLR